MRRTRVTPLRYQAATDASGGVARQQNITHAHESPFYHYAQFPHPFTITYRGKKYSRILFGQPSYIRLPPDATSSIALSHTLYLRVSYESYNKYRLLP
jgi:hypothetical protein